MNEQLLGEWETEVEADATRVRTRFPAAAREIGRSPATTDPGAERVEDDVRGRLLEALARGADGATVDREVHDLYRFGDADERRAVLRGLHRVEPAPAEGWAADLVHDALRTNDPRLVAAALGPYGAAVLDDDAWRQAVLKCLFVGVPVDLVHGLDARVDDRLLTMIASYADERRAAGREVPADAERLLATTDTTTQPGQER
ncbi:EboA domain-containing protein [Nocardioides marinquilinus]|uniref:EboA domain-containing protein n=1 Tax=Nocardioides marinquilinus TaxID=1210400 RepID=A0ABP9PF38_9ACTN